MNPRDYLNLGIHPCDICEHDNSFPRSDLCSSCASMQNGGLPSNFEIMKVYVNE